MEGTDTLKSFYFGKKEEILRFLKFAVTGVMNTAVDFAAFAVLSYLGVEVYLAQTISYAAGMLNSYAVNRSWTFGSRERFFSPVMLRFIAANLLLLLLSLAVIWLLHGQMGLPKFVAKLFATGFTVVAGFGINRLWVFRKS